MKRPFIADKESLDRRIDQAYRYADDLMMATNNEKGVLITVEYYEQKRSLEQNDKMWAMLTDISKQVPWLVDGQMRMLDPEDWKQIISAGLSASTRVAPGIEGGFVILGKRTSKFTIKQMIEMIELIQFFGDSKEVKWSEPKKENAK